MASFFHYHLEMARLEREYSKILSNSTACLFSEYDKDIQHRRDFIKNRLKFLYKTLGCIGRFSVEE